MQGPNATVLPPTSNSTAPVAQRPLEFRFRTYFLIGFGLAIVGTIFVYLTPVPTHYQSRAWVRMRGDRPFVTMGGLHESTVIPRALVQMIKSPDVLNHVIDNPDVAALPEFRGEGSPIQLLAKRISVEEHGFENYAIAYETEYRASAHLVASTVAAAFVERRFVVAVGKDECNAICARLEQEKSAIEAELEELRDQLRKLLDILMFQPVLYSDHNLEGTDLPPELKEHFAQLTEVETDLVVLRANMQHAENKALIIEVGAFTEFERALAVERMPQVTNLAERRGKLRRLIEGGDSENVALVLAEIDSLNKQLSKLRRAVRSRALRQEVARTKHENSVLMDHYRSEMKRYTTEARLIRNRIDLEKSHLEKSKLGSSFVQEYWKLLIALEEVDRCDTLITHLDQRIETLQVEFDGPPRVELLTAASESGVTISRRAVSPLRLATVCVLAFLLPIFLAVVLSHRCCVESSRDVDDAMGI